MPRAPSTAVSEQRGWPRAVWGCLGAILIWDVIQQTLLVCADPKLPVLDARGYWDLAALMVAGDWCWWTEPIAYRTPGYPAFLAVFQGLCGSNAFMVTVICQHLLVMFTSIATAWACGRLSNNGWAAVAGYALSVACVNRAWSANLLLTETLFAFLLALVILADIKYRRRPTSANSILVALLLGIATIVRPITILLWVPLGTSWVLFPTSGLSWRRRAGHAGLLVLVMFALLAPWYVRNWKLFGEPFLTSFLGRNLWVVTFQEGEGAGLALPDGEASDRLAERVHSLGRDVRLRETWQVSNALRESGLDDHRTDQLMKRVCLDATWTAPKRVADRTLRRTVSFWRCVANPYPGYDSPDAVESFGQARWNSPLLAEAFQQLTRHAPSRSVRLSELFALITFVALIMMLSDARLRPLAVDLGLVLLYFNLVTAACEIPAYRYRMVLEPEMIVLVVCGFCVARRRIGHS